MSSSVSKNEGPGTRASPPSSKAGRLRSQAPVIAIDGPAGAGKGEIAQYLAERLKWRRLDSGALYRVAALAVIRAGLLDSGEACIAAHLAECRLDFEATGDGDRVFLNGEDVSAAIRDEEVGVAASRVAPLAAVRQALLPWQRSFRREPGLVAEGRDMASVVFPDAPVQIYLTASPEMRAKRRHKQLEQKGINASMRDLIRDLTERDRRDSVRKLAPLKRVRHAVVLDTTSLDVRQTKSAAWRLVTKVWPEKAAG